MDDEVSNVEHAKSFCQQCTVREECLEYALENGEKYDVWGGLTSDERRALRLRLKRLGSQLIRNVG